MENIEGEGKVGFLLYFLVFSLMLILFLLSLYAGYILYKNLSPETQNLRVMVSNNGSKVINLTGEVKQFSKNMKFDHNNLTYLFYECLTFQEEKVKKAFEVISNQTENLITFTQTKGTADIEILCSESSKQTLDMESDYFIAGEGGAKEIIQTDRYSIITSGSVLLYDSPGGAMICNMPNVEIHEILHVFGFDHSTDENSLMYPYLTSCKQMLDPKIISELKRLYSEPSLPDLYFEDFATPTKKGRYLSLNFTIRNSGTALAKNSTFSILEEGEVLEVHNLGDIKAGAGVLMKMENIRLKSSSQESISIRIDNKNTIQEIDEQNNIAEIVI